jgi:hypothetical protein
MPSAAALPRDGLVLGRYRPVRPLGSGGSGSVWLARDEGSGLDVALKIVPCQGKAGPRAEREAAAAARLRHERCPRALALTEEDGHVYIAYEYVPGRTLREALRDGAVDDADAVEAAAQVCDGLAHAHARGIVHRDVKPSNVLLAEGEGVSIRLLDFGLAQMEEEETLTAVGDVPGTLAYISPERLAGRPATAASDVWAVGVMLWEALAGIHPFWKASVLESARAIGDGAPPLASARPDLPRPLLAAVDRALAAEPQRRPPAAKLARLLRESDFAGVRSRARPRVVPLPGVAARAAAAGLAALAAGAGALALPFYPGGWAPGLALLAAALTAFRERLGMALVLAVPLFPLGNMSLGLALVYAVVASAWLLGFAGDARAGLLPAIGVLPIPGAALALVPLAATAVRSPVRRAAVAVAAFIVALVAAGLRRGPLPLSGETPPLGLGLAGSDDAGAVATALHGFVSARPSLLLAAVVLVAAAVTLPLVRGRSTWWIAGWGTCVLAALLLPAPSLAAAPIVIAVWATCIVVAVTGQNEGRGG